MNEPPKIEGSQKIRILIIFAAGGAAVVAMAGGYFLAKKFLRDRAAAMNLAAGKYTLEKVKNPSANRQVKTYTREEIEKLRKEGKLPAGMRQALPPAQPVLPQDDAVQRSLRTIEEINRINEMNQRLLDQQQRMQKQK